jgi:hypothetical protein
MLSVSRDTLNPLLNTDTLKARLEAIDHYKYRHGVQMAHWPHFAMNRMSRHLWKYKANYIVKGAVVYMLVRDFQHMRHMHRTSYVTFQQEQALVAPMLVHGGMFAALCAFI